VKFGDLDTGKKFGETGPANGIKFGEAGIVADAEAKLGDVDTGGKFGDIGASVGARLGEAIVRAVGIKFGDVAAAVFTASISGDTDSLVRLAGSLATWRMSLFSWMRTAMLRIGRESPATLMRVWVLDYRR